MVPVLAPMIRLHTLPSSWTNSAFRAIRAMVHLATTRMRLKARFANDEDKDHRPVSLARTMTKDGGPCPAAASLTSLR